MVRMASWNAFEAAESEFARRMQAVFGTHKHHTKAPCVGWLPED